MFTDKFISFPCRIYNNAHDEYIKEMGLPEIKEKDRPLVDFKFIPGDLISYYPTFSDCEDMDILDNTVVNIKGDVATLIITVAEFEKKLNEFTKRSTHV